MPVYWKGRLDFNTPRAQYRLFRHSSRIDLTIKHWSLVNVLKYFASDIWLLLPRWVGGIQHSYINVLTVQDMQDFQTYYSVVGIMPHFLEEYTSARFLVSIFLIPAPRYSQVLKFGRFRCFEEIFQWWCKSDITQWTLVKYLAWLQV